MTTMNVRPPKDLVGFTHTAEGIERVVAQALEAERERLAENERALGLAPDTVFTAGISPHDDYRYASRVFVHLYPQLRARHVVAIGVAHKAALFPEVEGKLVFDSFDAWHGPYGAVPISPLRADLLEGLSAEDALVHEELQRIEHSVEALVPFLQHFDRDALLVPVLVPYMSFERLSELAARMAAVLAAAMEARGLELGEDVAILISSDAVHYGDDGWGGVRFDDFGVDQAGYERGVARDRRFIADYLTGAPSLEKLSELFHHLVEEDVHEYRVSWCGRFSIPFGVALLSAIEEDLALPASRGRLLRYGTTLDPGASDPGVEGLGFTAPANLRHWVGFASIGYWPGSR